jgi:hypothetical protein
MLLFRKNLFDPMQGITKLLYFIDYEVVEESFEKRIEEMDAMADIINIYVLCEREIRRHSRSNGVDVVINLYLDYLWEQTCSSMPTEGTRHSNLGEEKDNGIPSARTLANNWRRLKPAAVFHYLHKCQGRMHPVFSPPLVRSADFAEDILALSEFQSIKELILAHDYISSRLNDVFGLDLPVVDTPPPSLKLDDDAEYKQKLLKLLN